MRTIRSLPYEIDFYWKGSRYRQLLRAKDKKSKGKILCYKRDNIQERINMPTGRLVKPVIVFRCQK